MAGQEESSTAPARPLVMVTAPLHDQATALLESFAEVRVARSPSPADLRSAAGGADAIIVRNPLPEDICDHAPRLRAVVRHGTGLDFIPVERMTAANVRVANVPDANVQSVAEHVIASMFLLARRLDRQDRQVRAGNWAVRNESRVELAGKTLGLVGFGRIGRRVARLALGLGMKVMACSRRAAAGEAGVVSARLDDLLASSDVVSLHVPLTPQTTGLIDSRALRLMKPAAFLVNTARGAVVVEQALIEHLREGRLAGAALDVFVDQPIGADHPFTSLQNVILTPHSAAVTEEAMLRMGLQSVEEVRLALSSEVSENVVNGIV